MYCIIVIVDIFVYFLYYFKFIILFICIVYNCNILFIIIIIFEHVGILVQGISYFMEEDFGLFVASFSV